MTTSVIRRFIAFSTITGNSIASAETARQARDLAVQHERLSTDDYLEVLDCEDRGEAVWQHRTLLSSARQRHRTAFRGLGFGTGGLPPVAMED